ncbi:DUF1259 domain-containing protein [Ralstonia soli]|uniref:DUF1259 domain-containing protein n=1 Tax=Ralstonia soli TaxID=2953896 RepID=A0ABT1AQZ9_9RALS|nr:DUF1259 domain-containing protein [Ralstonia soli]MCO5400883.1 DUF1259 domain-containing protein [Ralstonia soli]
MSLPSRIALVLATIACACTLASAAPSDRHPTLDRAQIEQITGLKGSFSEAENVFKVTKPRTDVPVQVDGLAMAPFMGLTSWAAFTPAHGGRVMLMGDTVVFEDEVNPAMSAALDAGLEVTALHNHFFFDRPKVYFMHIAGMGDASQLAAGVKKVYDKIAEVRAANAAPAMTFPGRIGAENTITPAPLEAVLGKKGQASNGMFKVVVGAPGSMHGTPIGNEMGVNTWAAFAGTDDEAIVDGDFVMREDELQPVLKSMRGDGINIVAIHQHMTHEQPRYMFLHYWGKGHADTLAKAVRKALDAQAAVKK